MKKKNKSKNPELNIVPLHPRTRPHVGSLYESIFLAIQDYSEQTDQVLSKAEVVGTLEFVKAQIMELYK